VSERNNFIDYIRIFCKSGHGGAGARHFMRNKLTAMGGLMVVMEDEEHILFYVAIHNCNLVAFALL
jgi:hypothetical protein